MHKSTSLKYETSLEPLLSTEKQRLVQINTQIIRMIWRCIQVIASLSTHLLRWSGWCPPAGRILGSSLSLPPSLPLSIALYRSLSLSLSLSLALSLSHFVSLSHSLSLTDFEDTVHAPDDQLLQVQLWRDP